MIEGEIKPKPTATDNITRMAAIADGMFGIADYPDGILNGDEAVNEFRELAARIVVSPKQERLTALSALSEIEGSHRLGVIIMIKDGLKKAAKAAVGRKRQGEL